MIRITPGPRNTVGNHPDGTMRDANAIMIRNHAPDMTTVVHRISTTPSPPIPVSHLRLGLNHASPVTVQSMDTGMCHHHRLQDLTTMAISNSLDLTMARLPTILDSMPRCHMILDTTGTLLPEVLLLLQTGKVSSSNRLRNRRSRSAMSTLVPRSRRPMMIRRGRNEGRVRF